MTHFNDMYRLKCNNNNFKEYNNKCSNNVCVHNLNCHFQTPRNNNSLSKLK